jgi:N-methylhydantoinase B
MPDPVELEVFKNLYHSIAEEMGAALRRTSFSPNIKERRDYSCAVFDSAGQVVAMGDHMPVHLGFDADVRRRCGRSSARSNRATSSC